MKEKTGKNIEVMVYGDGAFKDPTGRIWELADPVVSPGYTKGLEGTSNEIKLKYVADNEFSNLDSEDMVEAVKNKIKNKGSKETQGEKIGTTQDKLPIFWEAYVI